MSKRVALYVRVSTDGQTVSNQTLELEAVAKRHGWQIVEIFKDEGISGAKGRDSRPGFNALHTAITRKEVDMVAAWSVDRLGRSLRDLVAFLEELHSKDVGLYLHQQGLDTSTPSGRAMFGMLSVFSEFERAMIQGRIHAGLKRARANGKTLGRPKALTPKQIAHVRALRANGMGLRAIARQVGKSPATVKRALPPSPQ